MKQLDDELHIRYLIMKRNGFDLNELWQLTDDESLSQGHTYSQENTRKVQKYLRYEGFDKVEKDFGGDGFGTPESVYRITYISNNHQRKTRVFGVQRWIFPVNSFDA